MAVLMAQDGALLADSWDCQRIELCALTVYKIDYSDVDEKPETLLMCLKILVGEREFEPPTSWRLLECQPLLHFPGFRSSS
jgi:hypothetical protein